jgi:hypothetical protein
MLFQGYFMPDIPSVNVGQQAEFVKESAYGFLGRSGIIAIFVVLIIFFILFVVFLILRNYLRNKRRLMSAFQKVVLLVTVPKESPSKEAPKKDLKEMLAPVESFYDNLGGLRAQRGKLVDWLGRTDHFAFEIIVNQEGIISFYIVVPRYLQQFIEQQIHAQYPAAQIDEVQDYNIFSPEKVVMAAYLRLRRHWLFPINTYLKKITSDPLDSITNALVRVNKGDAAGIQIVARSARGEWHKLGAKVALEMNQGKPLKEALKSVLGGGGLNLSSLKDFFTTKSASKGEMLKERRYQPSPMEQEMIKSLEDKTSKAGLDVNIRIVVSASNKETAKLYLQNILNSFAQFTGYEYGNGFKPVILKRPDKVVYDFIYRNFDEKNSFILNTEEMAGIFHLPLPTTETPNIRWLLAKRAPAPVNIPQEGIILGENVFRGERKIIRIKDDDRRRHVYIIGRTGTGKSTLISNMAIQDIEAGKGVCVIDPHGDLIEKVLGNVPESRIEDVILFDPSDTTRPMGLNLLEFDPRYPEQKTFVINEMIQIMDKLYDLRQTGGPMFEQYMRNAMLLIMEHPESGSTLMEISKVLADPDFRHFKIEHSKNYVVNDFWLKEAEKAGGEVALSNMTPYITSKLNQFVSNDTMRPIIGQQKSAFNFREIMDKQKVLLINLSKGKIGDMNAYLLGLVLVGKILMAALSRIDIPEEERKDYYLYIDEFQNFITPTIATILAEARKYRLDLIIAHQYIGQLVTGNDTTIRDAVLGTVGTIIAYKVGVQDAEILAKEFAPVFNEFDLVNIEAFNAYVKLLVNNEAVRPFSMRGFPSPKPNLKIAETIKEISRMKYGRPKEVVEKEILERAKMVTSKTKRANHLEEIERYR